MVILIRSKNVCWPFKQLRKAFKRLSLAFVCRSLSVCFHSFKRLCINVRFSVKGHNSAYDFLMYSYDLMKARLSELEVHVEAGEYSNHNAQFGAL